MSVSASVDLGSSNADAVPAPRTSRFGAPIATVPLPDAAAHTGAANQISHAAFPGPTSKRAVDYSSLMAEPPTADNSTAQMSQPSAGIAAPTTSSSSIGAITPGAAAALASIAALTGQGLGNSSGEYPASTQPFAGQFQRQGGVFDARKAQLDQKKKLLWARKKQEVQTIEAMQAGSAHQNKEQWRAAEFGGNQVEKARFLKMMGDKQGAAAAEDEMTKLKAAQEEELELLDKMHEASASTTNVRLHPPSSYKRSFPRQLQPDMSHCACEHTNAPSFKFTTPALP